MLLLNLLPVTVVDTLHGLEHGLHGRPVIGVRVQFHGHLVPEIFSSRQLFVKGRSGLKEHGVGEDRDPTGGIEVGTASCQFQHVKANQTDISDIPSHAGYADAVADFHSIAADNEEISGDGKQDRLKPYGKAGGDESGK